MEFPKNGRSILLTMTQPAKNSTLCKTNKSEILVRLLTTGRNPEIENLSRFIENICAPLASNLPNIIKDTSHFLDLIDDIKKKQFTRYSSFVRYY